MTEFLTLFIAGVALYVSYATAKKQESLTTQSLKIEMYSKRYDIYKRLNDIIQRIVTNLKTFNVAYELGGIRDEVVFLFDTEIQDYLLEIINKYEIVLKNDDIDKHIELLEWFDQQYSKKGLRNKFSRYLDLSNYGLSQN